MQQRGKTGQTRHALCARAALSDPAHPGLLATGSAASVGPEMRVARVENSPEPAEHGLHLGAASAAATRRRPAFAPTFTFCPFKQKQKQRNKDENEAKTNARDSLEQETFLWAGRARSTDGTYPRASSGARSAVSGPFPEASVAGMAASLICPRLGTLHGGGAGADASGVAACSPWRYRRAGREAPIDRRLRSVSIEPIYFRSDAKIMGCAQFGTCLLYTSPSPRDKRQSRMPSSA